MLQRFVQILSLKLPSRRRHCRNRIRAFRRHHFNLAAHKHARGVVECSEYPCENAVEEREQARGPCPAQRPVRGVAALIVRTGLTSRSCSEQWRNRAIIFPAVAISSPSSGRIKPARASPHRRERLLFFRDTSYLIGSDSRPARSTRSLGAARASSFCAHGVLRKGALSTSRRTRIFGITALATLFRDRYSQGPSQNSTAP